MGPGFEAMMVLRSDRESEQAACFTCKVSPLHLSGRGERAVALWVVAAGALGFSPLPAVADSPPSPGDANPCRAFKPIEGYDTWSTGTAAPDPASSVSTVDRAKLAAREALLRRILGESNCAERELATSVHLEANAAPSPKGDVCARAMIANDDLARFRARHMDQEQGLLPFRKAVAERVLPVPAAAKTRRSGSAGAKRYSVVDYGADQKFQARVALEVRAALGAGVVPWNTAWQFPPIPKGVHIVLVPRPHPPAADSSDLVIGLDAFEATHDGQLSVRTWLLPAVSRCLLPEPDFAPMRRPGGMFLDWRSPRGDLVCHGDHLRPVLVSTATRPLYVRVLNVWGAGSGAMVTWPRADTPARLVQPGSRTELGTMEALATDVPIEKFIVLTAETEAALDREVGTLAASQACRMPAATVWRLHEMKAPRTEGIMMDIQPLRVLAGGRCGAELGDDQRADTRRRLEEIPPCGE